MVVDPFAGGGSIPLEALRLGCDAFASDLKPLASLRQSFLNGALTRLLDPDRVLRDKIPEFVLKGDFGLASGQKSDGTYDRVWYGEPISSDEVSFEPNVFLLTKVKAKVLKGQVPPGIQPGRGSQPGPGPEPGQSLVLSLASAQTRTLRLVGTVPPEIWNRLGTKIIPKLKSGTDLKIGVDFTVTVSADLARNLESDLRQILEDLNLQGKIKIEQA